MKYTLSIKNSTVDYNTESIYQNKFRIISSLNFTHILIKLMENYENFQILSIIVSLYQELILQNIT